MISNPQFEIANFREAMAREGIVMDGEIIPDGKLHRAHADGDGAESKNAWYVLHLDGRPVGRFGSWRLGISSGWAAEGEGRLTGEEREALDRQIAAAQQGREAERIGLEAQARRRARYIWERSGPASQGHLYLTVKRVGAHGLREYKGSLVVPLYDALGVLHSLQFIAPDGRKRFLAHGRVEGCFCGLGTVSLCPNPQTRSPRLWIAEGFATAATVRELTAEPVAVAFNAGNLGAVARAIRGRLPAVVIVLAADDDRWTWGNPGLTKAMEAAMTVQGLVAVPHFADLSAKPTDWNDLYRLVGAGETKARLMRAV